jgi:hypothetical protein
LEDSRLEQGLLSYVLIKEGLTDGKADWKPVDGQITAGEWLSYAADRVPKFKDPEKSQPSDRGVALISTGSSGSQIPAVFDFSKTDGFAIQK